MIELQHLRKEYGSLVAVKDLTFRLEAGDIFGFIGPNGAGKTTTIKMLATLLRPSSGRAFIAGLDVAEQVEQVRAIIGYMPDFFGVYDDIKVWEYLDFFAAAYRIPRDQRIIIEAGTPYIKREGRNAIRMIRASWPGYVLADLKTMDGAEGEAADAAAAGANVSFIS